MCKSRELCRLASMDWTCALKQASGEFDQTSDLLVVAISVTQPSQYTVKQSHVLCFTVVLDFRVTYHWSVKNTEWIPFNVKQRHLERRFSSFYISYACLPIHTRQNQPNSSTVNVLTCCFTSPLRSGWIEPEMCWTSFYLLLLF